jgi:hypothetical protein
LKINFLAKNTEGSIIAKEAQSNGEKITSCKVFSRILKNWANSAFFDKGAVARRDSSRLYVKKRSMLNKLLKYSFKALLLIPIVVVLLLNLSLHYTPSFVKTINEDELAQLHFLENALHHQAAGEQMQTVFPEGFLFINVLYGLAYADFMEKSGISPQSTLGKKAEKEINWAIAEINSETGKSIFLDELPLENGAFYKGWQSYLLGRKLQVSATKDAVLVQQFQSNCEAISRAISATNKPYLESYKGAAWPADNILCLASLALHDRIFAPKYQTVITTWLDRIKTHLDENTGLVPHSFSLIYDKGIETRGSSQSLILSFLPKIDPVFAQNQYKIYKKLFIEEKNGLPAVREYRMGIAGGGDIDSGPVIWDVGGSASIVGVRAAAENGDFELSKSLRNSIEAFAFSTHFGKEKKYLFGQLPVIDAFMAWSNAVVTPATEPKSSGGSWQFYLLSVLFSVPFCWWVYRL